MFDIDGTLVESYEMDSACFVQAVKDVTGVDIDTNWANYQHVTDSGILNEFIKLNGLDHNQHIHREVKKAFIELLEKSINENPIQQIPGASSFVSQLTSMSEVVVSLATGGWYESAALKLTSAGIDYAHLPIATSNDHESRIEIMQIAAARANASNVNTCTYFGDGSWDKEACRQLGYNFVLVGDKIAHDTSIEDYRATNEIAIVLGL